MVSTRELLRVVYDQADNIGYCCPLASPIANAGTSVNAT